MSCLQLMYEIHTKMCLSESNDNIHKYRSNSNYLGSEMEVVKKFMFQTHSICELSTFCWINYNHSGHPWFHL